jgi:tRNA pseudouridine13 synthase
MLVYSTRAPGAGGVIKDRPEDFVVSEVLSEMPGAGGMRTFTVTKVDRNTLDVAEELGKRVGCRIKFWGMKDKRSISTQFMQCAGGGRATRSVISGRGWSATSVGLWDELGPAYFAGNAFRIRLRNFSGAVEEVSDAVKSGGIANFFGYQRFGAVNQNHMIGRCIVMRNAAGCPGRASLKSAPRRIRALLVNAYQSYLFNMALSRVLSTEGELPVRASVVHRLAERPFRRAMEEPLANPASYEGTVPSAPVPGYSYRARGDVYSRALDEVMAAEGVRPRDFYVDDMPEVSAEGGWRPAVVLGRMDHREDPPDMMLNLLLQRGSYATVLLREILKPEDPVSAGLAT